MNLLRNLKFLTIATGVILVWRGVWGLADIYLLPNIPVLSFVISIVLGVVILLIINPKQHDIKELL